MLVDIGSTTPSVRAVAIAASIALPPFFRMLTPASTASGWLLATIPSRAITTDRRAAKPARSTRLVSNMLPLLFQAATGYALNGALSYAGQTGKSKVNRKQMVHLRARGG